MAKDHRPKKPTNFEKMLYEALTRQDKLEQNLHAAFKAMNDINQRLVSICRAKMEPEILTMFYLDLKANEAYMARLNACIDLAMAEKEKKINDAAAGTTPPTGEGSSVGVNR